MNIPIDVMLEAADALAAVENYVSKLQVCLRAGGFIISDPNKLPGEQTIGTYDAMESAETELQALKDARRVTAVARVIAAYERKRVWDAAILAVEGTYVPTVESAPPSALKLMEMSSKVECVISGAINSKDTAVLAVKAAAKRDRAQNGEFPDTPMGSA